MSRRRFFVSGFEAATATLAGEQAHHLGRVLRARPGQLYELSDGRELWLARVSAVSRERISFELVERLPAVEPAIEIVLLVAIVKFERMEWLLEKATELAVTEIVPVAAQRSERRLVQGASKRRARWEKILLEAAQQARRVRLPVLGPTARLGPALARVETGLKIILAESSDAPSLKSVLRAAGSPGRVAVAIGPEGGWTESELRLAQGKDFKPASLGHLILRSETAVLAALAAINYEFA